MKLIPAIDLRGGKCVRLYQGDFEQQTDYSADPVAVARRFSELNVEDLHLVDLDGARCGEQQNRDIVAAITRQTRLAVQLGGGIRDASTVENWFSLGVERCVIGSVAVAQPDSVREWIESFGASRMVLALDVRIEEGGEPMLTTHGWTQTSEMTLWEGLDFYAGAGLMHVLCTDVSRDGALAGPNLDLYREMLRRYPALAVQASGGVRDIHDLAALREAGVPAAISGRALLDGRIRPDEVASFQQDA